MVTRQTRAERLLERMVEAAPEVGLEVRYENISRPGYPGGLCRIKQRWVVILNKGAPAEERLATLASAIASQNTEDVFLPPDVREAVDTARPLNVKGEAVDGAPGVKEAEGE